MKKKLFLALILLVTLALGITGCTSTKQDLESSDEYSEIEQPIEDDIVEVDNTEKDGLDDEMEHLTNSDISENESPLEKPDNNLDKDDIEDTNKNITYTYFIPNSQADGLNPIILEDISDEDASNPQFYIDLLIANGIVPSGTVVNSFTINNGIGYLDLSKEYDSKNYGTAGEAMLLDSTGNTFIKSFNLDKLKLTIDGENYSSGHIEHGDDDYLTFVNY